MRSSDYLHRALEAQRRIAAIDETLFGMREAIGVQGQSYERHPKNDVLDPMRRVCTLMDAERELDRERAERELDIEEARALLDGAALEIGDNASTALELAYSDGWTVDRIAAWLCYPRDLTAQVVAEGPRMLDGYDAVRLLHQGRRAVAPFHPNSSD